MKRLVLNGISGIACFVISAFQCAPLPSDPLPDPEDASIELFFPNGVANAEMGEECRIGLKIGLAHHIDSIEIASSCNDYFQAFPLVSEKIYDTLHFTPIFQTEGYCTLFVRGFINSEINERKNQLVVQVLPSVTDTFLDFSSSPEPFTTHTGATDTLLFTLDRSCGVAYTLGCSPVLDSTELHFAPSADSGTSRVHFDPDQPGNYVVTLLAEAGSHSTAATVAINVLPSFTPIALEHPDTLVAGILDTIIYMLSREQIALGIDMGVIVDENIVCGTIGVIPAGSDSLLIIVNSPMEGSIVFSVITANETLSDTLTRTIVFIDDSGSVESEESFIDEATEGLPHSPFRYAGAFQLSALPAKNPLAGSRQSNYYRQRR